MIDSISPSDLKEGMSVTISCTMEFYAHACGGGLYFKLPRASHIGADVQEVYFHNPEMVEVVSVIPTPLLPDDFVYFDGRKERVIAVNETDAWITSETQSGQIVMLEALSRVTNIPILIKEPA